jgi:hypothetical protein
MNKKATFFQILNRVWGRSGSCTLFVVVLLGSIPVSNLQAQQPKDVALPVTATVSTSPASITISWPNPSASGILVIRRTKGNPGSSWIAVLNVSNSLVNSVIDNTVTAGQTYEYLVQRTGTITSFGYAHVALQAPVTDYRGKLLVVIDSTSADALGVELKQLKDDMRGDGWEIVPMKIGPAATVTSVKAMIKAQYDADPTKVKAVLLFGRVPVPYSGNSAWDGHSDHVGAWPCDNYYADMDGIWTDASVSNTSATRVANQNVPGDGKFDQSYMPSAAELQVGRVDFRRLSQSTFGLSEIELLRRYLVKDHLWRSGQYTVSNKALVDDNFGFFNGEAFAENGFRNAHPLMPAANIVEGDFFNDTDSQSFLLGYGCGGGWYQGASGVGSSSNFGTDSVNVVFSALFGSYFGDWDHETDPFMPAAIASRGGILTCAWQGRPHWFQHAFASGETIGYCTQETQNAQFNNGFIGTFGESGAHVALMGDPTLRAHIVAPPSNISLAQACTHVNVSWTASATAGVLGYHVYRSDKIDGLFTRISGSLVNGTNFTDMAPLADTLYYQVRAIKQESTPAGGIYLNNSTSAIVRIIIPSLTGPALTTAASGAINCSGNPITLEVSANAGISGDFSWTGPGNFSGTGASLEVNTAGVYTVSVTGSNACTASATLTVDSDVATPGATAQGGVITCNQGVVTLQAQSNDPNATYAWSGPGGFTATTANPSTDFAGIYEVTVTSANQCTSTATASVVQDTQPPIINFSGTFALTCTNPCREVVIPPFLVGYTFTINGTVLQPGQSVNICDPGVYGVVVTQNSNGCTNSTSVTITGDFAQPDVQISGEATLTCAAPSSQLSAASSVNGVTFVWSGPGVNGQTGASVTATQPGDYSVTATNPANGCTQTDAFTVDTDGNIPSVSASGGTLTCAITSLQISANSPISGLSYAWNGPGGFESTEQNPIVNAPGSYTVTITAGNGCTNTAATTVNEDTEVPVFSLLPLEQLDCNTPCLNIQVDVDINPDFSYAPQTVCTPGPFSVTGTNAVNGCTFVVNATAVQAPELVVIPFLSVTGCNTALLEAQTTGGTSPYQYIWSTGATTAAINSQGGGLYTVTVSDSGGCNKVLEFLLTPPAPLVATGLVDNASSTQVNDGSINQTITGGVSPYSFLWNTGAITEDLSNLGAGTYTCTVTDAIGCTSTSSYTVTAPISTWEAAGVLELNLSPNPTSGLARLQFRLDAPQSAGFILYDAYGRIMSQKTPVIYTEGTFLLDMTPYPPGVYQVSLLLEQHQLRIPLTVVR